MRVGDELGRRICVGAAFCSGEWEIELLQIYQVTCRKGVVKSILLAAVDLFLAARRVPVQYSWTGQDDPRRDPP